MQLGKRADGAVEDEIFGAFRKELVDAELRAAVLTKCDIRIDLALHDVELVVNGRQTAFRLDQDLTLPSMALPTPM